MSSLSSVVMTNVQSHVSTKLEFPATGLIRLWGENSNGKSVLVKVLSDVASNAISKPKLRKSIIRRGCSYCELLLNSTDGAALYVKIHEEAAQTFAELTRPNEPPLRRYLADKAIPQLVSEFGIHYSPDAGISINIHRDDDPFLFVSTKHSTNYELMGPSLSDPHAERSLAGLENLYKETQRIKRDTQQRLEVLKAALDAIQVWDVEAESQRRDILAHIAHNLRCADIPPMPTLEAVPDIRIYDMMPAMPNLILPKVYEILPPMPDILPEAREYVTASEGTCPTCGRPF